MITTRDRTTGKVDSKTFIGRTPLPSDFKDFREGVSRWFPERFVADMTAFAVTATAFLTALLVLAVGAFLLQIATPPIRLIRGLLILSLACLMPAISMSQFSRDHPHYNTVFYAMNTDIEDAAWVSFDERTDAWTSQFLGSKPVRARNPEILLGRDTPLLMRKAPSAPIPPPVASVVSDEEVGNKRLLKLHLLTIRRANVVEFRLPAKTGLESLTLNHRKVDRMNMGGTLKPWVVRYANVPQGGLDVELLLNSDSPLILWLGDLTYSLPSLPNFEYQSRPDSMMAWWGSDVTLIERKYEY